MKAILRSLTLFSAGALLLPAQAVTPRAPGRPQRAIRPLTPVELLMKLYHSTPAAATTAIRTRGVGFDVTPALEKLLLEAGADKPMLALAALRRVEFEATPASAPSVKMDAAVQARKLVSRVDAAHPAEARGSAGRVNLEVQIGTDGRVKTARVVSGDAPFAAAAQRAVLGYVYRPTVLDGEAVEVTTEVIVDFDLAAAGSRN